MPKAEEVQELLIKLVDNGLQFIERSKDELDTDPTFSVAHFAVGVELLLKARLFFEHWSLVAVQPHSVTWQQVKDGTVATIQASALVATIANLTGNRQLLTPKDASQKQQDGQPQPPPRFETLIDRLLSHRNKIVHFVPSQKKEDIAAEQLRCWYQLHALMTGEWKTAFHDHGEAITAIDEELREHHSKYLAIRYDELDRAHRFTSARHRDGVIDCSRCEYNSAILSTPQLRISLAECPVCLQANEVARDTDDVWHSIDERERLSETMCRSCETRDSIIDIDTAFLCTECGAIHPPESVTECEWCSQRWAGDAPESEEDEDTYSYGCGECGGSYEYMINKDD
ncbi:MAG: hypothetical protein R3B09_10340 [Nannocystaceae bacterium]